MIDATCPLVAKVHNEGRRYASQGREIVLVGHAGHAEVEGTIGQVPAKVHLVQTVADVAGCAVADPGQARLHHPDDAVGRRHPRHHRGIEGAVPLHRRAGFRTVGDFDHECGLVLPKQFASALEDR